MIANIPRWRRARGDSTQRGARNASVAPTPSAWVESLEARFSPPLGAVAAAVVAIAVGIAVLLLAPVLLIALTKAADGMGSAGTGPWSGHPASAAYAIAFGSSLIVAAVVVLARRLRRPPPSSDNP